MGVFLLVLSGNVRQNPGPDSKLFTLCLRNIRPIRNKSAFVDFVKAKLQKADLITVK